MIESDDFTNSDTYGQGTYIESFYQGMNVWVSGVMNEWRAQTVAPVTPYQSWGPAAGDFDLGVVSRAATDTAKVLVLTATAGTPAAAKPASLTASLAIQEKGFNVEVLMGPTHRMVPFMFRIIPNYISLSAVGARYFTTT